MLWRLEYPRRSRGKTPGFTAPLCLRVIYYFFYLTDLKVRCSIPQTRPGERQLEVVLVASSVGFHHNSCLPRDETRGKTVRRQPAQKGMTSMSFLLPGLPGFNIALLGSEREIFCNKCTSLFFWRSSSNLQKNTHVVCV